MSDIENFTAEVNGLFGSKIADFVKTYIDSHRSVIAAGCNIPGYPSKLDNLYTLKYNTGSNGHGVVFDIVCNSTRDGNNYRIGRLSIDNQFQRHIHENSTVTFMPEMGVYNNQTIPFPELCDNTNSMSNVKFREKTDVIGYLEESFRKALNQVGRWSSAQPPISQFKGQQDWPQSGMNQNRPPTSGFSGNTYRQQYYNPNNETPAQGQGAGEAHRDLTGVIKDLIYSESEENRRRLFQLIVSNRMPAWFTGWRVNAGSDAVTFIVNSFIHWSKVKIDRRTPVIIESFWNEITDHFGSNNIIINDKYRLSFSCLYTRNGRCNKQGCQNAGQAAMLPSKCSIPSTSIKVVSKSNVSY